MTKNGSTLWGPIKEIPTSELEFRMQFRKHTWTALSDELMLRLEKTPPSAALEVPFEDERVGKRAYDALKKHFEGMGVDVLLNSRADGNGGRIVYVRRGPTWGKSS